MNLYEAISQNEYLSAVPVLRSASHLSHISIISKYNADIQSLDSKTVGTPWHTKPQNVNTKQCSEACDAWMCIITQNRIFLSEVLFCLEIVLLFDIVVLSRGL